MHAPEIFSLNIDDMDVQELERRLEMAIATTAPADCPQDRGCSCPALASCGTYCTADSQ